MKTYLSPVARIIALYDEAELMTGSDRSVAIQREADVDDADKSNRRSGIWDDL